MSQSSWFSKHSVPSPSDSETTLYPLEQLKADFECKELKDGYIVLNWDSDKLKLEFAVFQMAESDCDGKNVLLSLVFYGTGFCGALRECRHTYWGEEGYIFYPDGALITQALKELSNYFDGMA